LENLPGKGTIRFSPLLHAYVRFLKEELDSLAEKIKGAVRSAITQFSHYYALLKDLVGAVGVHDPDCLDTRFLVFVQTVLKKYEDIKPIVSQFTKLLNQSISIRPFREKITPVQWEELISYCISFFTEDQENSSAQDRRGECVDLAMVFCQLVTCQRTDSVMEHADHVLKFISQYIRRYSFENNAFEIFLSTAIQVLHLLDVDQLDLSLQFVKSILPRLIDFLASKSESLRIAAVNLLRMYIVMGSDRDEDDIFLRNATRVQAKLYDHISKHSISPIPTLVFHQLLTSPDYEREFPSGVLSSWAYVSLFSDLCWLEIHASKDQTESQSTESQTTQISGRPMKRMRTKLFKSYPQNLLQDKSLTCFGLQVLMRMMYRRPTTIENVVADHFSLIFNLALNGDLGCVNEARMCCMVILELRPGLQFNASELLDKSITSINQTVVGYHGTFLLLAQLVKTRRISSDSMVSLLDWVCTLKSEQISRFTANLVIELVQLSHLWNHEQICTLVTFLYRIIRMEGKSINNQVFPCFLNSLRRIFQYPEDIDEQVCLFETDLSVGEEAAVFELMFDCFEKRIEFVSGYDGAKLVSKLWPVVETPIQVSSVKPLPNAIYDHAIKEMISCLDHIGDSITITRISIDPLLSFLSVCVSVQIVGYRNDHFALDPVYVKKLDAVGARLMASVRNVDLETSFAKFFELAPKLKKHVFFPLPESKSMELMDICFQQSVKPAAKLVERDFKTQKYQIMQISAYSEPLDVKKCTKIKSWLRILGYLTSYDEFSVERLESHLAVRLRNWLSRLFQDSTDCVGNLLILGNYYGTLQRILDSQLVALILTSYTNLMENPKYSRNFQCWVSCLKFLKVLLSRAPQLVSANTEQRIQITELVSFFHSSWESISNTVAMEIIQVLIFSRDAGIAVRSVNDYDTEIAKFLVLESFVSKFFTAKYIVPSLSPTMNWGPCIDSMLQFDGLSDSNSIGNCLVLGSIVYHNPNHFTTFFPWFAKLASIQPSLDTPDAILQKLSLHFKQPSLQDLTRQGLENSLQYWHSDCAEFPYFLFGVDSIHHFAQTFCKELCLVSFRNLDHKWIQFIHELLPNRSVWAEKALPVVYAEYVYRIAVNPTEKHQSKIFLQSIFKISEEEFHRILKVEYSTTLFELLLKMTGLDRFDGTLDGFLAAELAIYELPQENCLELPTSHAVIKAVELLCSASLAELSKSFSAARLLDIIQKFHSHLYRVGFEKEIKRVLSNGYIVLLLLGKGYLKHPLVLNTIFANLVEYLLTPSLSPYCSRILMILLTQLTLPFPESFPSQATRFLLKLNQIAMEALSSSFGQLPIICQLIDVILEKLQASDEKTWETSQLLVEPSLSPYLQCFRIKEEFVEKALVWSDNLDDCVFESSALLSRMSDFLDNSQRLITGLDRVACRIEHIMKKQKRSVHSDCDLSLAKLYGKVLACKRNQSSPARIGIESKSILVIALSQLTDELMSRQLELQVTSLNAVMNICSTNEGREAFRSLPGNRRCIIDILQQKPILVTPRASHCETQSIEGFWWSQGAERGNYVREFACGILDCFPFPDFLKHLKPMFEISEDFAVKMIPYLCSYALKHEQLQPSFRSSFLELLRRNLTCDYESNSLGVELAVKIVRELYSDGIRFSVGEIPLRDVARSAMLIDEVHTSLYFLERAFSDTPEMISNADWQILIECFEDLNESDGFQGALYCLDTSKMDMLTLVKQNLERHRDWLGLWSIEDALQGEDKTSLCRALGNSGHYSTLLRISAESKQQTSEMYQSLWRMGQWDISTANPTEPKDDFQHHIYHALKCYETCYSPIVTSDLVRTYLQLIVGAKACPKEVISLMEMDELLSSSLSDLKTIPTKWTNRRLSLQTEYSYVEYEPILSVRNRLLHSFHAKHSGSLAGESLKFLLESLLNLTNVAVENNDLMLSRRLIKELEFLRPSMNREQDLQLQFESIRTEWQSGQFTIPMRYLEKLITEIDENQVELSKIYSNILLTMGTWSIDRKSAVSRDILEKYLKRSIVFLEKTSHYDRGKHYFSIASYCDTILAEMQADQTFKRSMTLLTKREASLAQALSNGHSKKDHFVRRLEKQIEIDKQMVASTLSEMSKLKSESIHNYLKVLIHSEYRTEHSLYRFFSLWFSSSGESMINQLVADELPKVPTKTFLPLMYQITARLFSQNRDDELFFRTLMLFVQNLVLDYPFHTLGYVLALRNVSKTAVKSNNAFQAISSETVSIFLSWIKKNKPVQIIAYHMDSMFNGYITTAYQAVPKSKDSKKKQLDANCALFKIKPEHGVPVITIEQPLHPPQVYDDIIHVVGFEKSFTVPGGINAPKVIKCLGSDGIMYKQLVKGKGLIVSLQMIYVKMLFCPLFSIQSISCWARTKIQERENYLSELTKLFLLQRRRE
jgi:hypothetical protein